MTVRITNRDLTRKWCLGWVYDAIGAATLSATSNDLIERRHEVLFRSQWVVGYGFSIGWNLNATNNVVEVLLRDQESLSWARNSSLSATNKRGSVSTKVARCCVPSVLCTRDCDVQCIAVSDFAVIEVIRNSASGTSTRVEGECRVNEQLGVLHVGHDPLLPSIVVHSPRVSTWDRTVITVVQEVRCAWVSDPIVFRIERAVRHTIVVVRIQVVVVA